MSDLICTCGHSGAKNDLCPQHGTYMMVPGRGSNVEGGKPGAAGHVYTTGLEWVYVCHFCDHRGRTMYSSDAFDALAEHIKADHVTIERLVPQ